MVTRKKARKTSRKGKAKSAGNKKPVKKRVELKVLGKSVLVDKDLKDRGHRMGLRAPKAGKDEFPSFYKKFVFKCGKCINEFKHTADIPVIEQKVKCPECEEMHLIRIIPIGGHYEIKLPKSIREVKDR